MNAFSEDLTKHLLTSKEKLEYFVKNARYLAWTLELWGKKYWVSFLISLIQSKQLFWKAVNLCEKAEKTVLPHKKVNIRMY